MKKYRKFLSLVLALLLLPALLAGCGGKKQDEFQVIFASPFVNEKRAEAYGGIFTPESGKSVKYSGFSFGSEDVDPMVYGAGAMMMSAMLAAAEVDVLVCDLENAARYARSGAFLDLTALFSQEELAEFSDSLLSFDMTDEYGTPTGEKTAPCGLEVTGSKQLDIILGGGSYGIFLVGSTGDIELAKEVFWGIVKQ